MGYYSSVRITVNKNDYHIFEAAVKGFLTENKASNLLEMTDVKGMYDVGTYSESVYLGWNRLKFYDDFPEVQAVMAGLDAVEAEDGSYCYMRLGEEYEDVDVKYYGSDVAFLEIGFASDQKAELENVIDYKSLILNCDIDQMKQIRWGIKQGIDVLVYADPKFDADQMERIRRGLEAGVDVSIYADPKFNFRQMQQIGWGLEKGIAVGIYAKPEFTWEQMEQIRWGIEERLDVSVYADPEFDEFQMRDMREQLEAEQSKQPVFSTEGYAPEENATGKSKDKSIDK